MHLRRGVDATLCRRSREGATVVPAGSGSGPAALLASQERSRRPPRGRRARGIDPLGPDELAQLGDPAAPARGSDVQSGGRSSAIMMSVPKSLRPSYEVEEVRPERHPRVFASCVQPRRARLLPSCSLATLRKTILQLAELLRRLLLSEGEAHVQRENLLGVRSLPQVVGRPARGGRPTRESLQGSERSLCQAGWWSFAQARVTEPCKHAAQRAGVRDRAQVDVDDEEEPSADGRQVVNASGSR